MKESNGHPFGWICWKFGGVCWAHQGDWRNGTSQSRFTDGFIKFPHFPKMFKIKQRLKDKIGEKCAGLALPKLKGAGVGFGWLNSLQECRSLWVLAQVQTRRLHQGYVFIPKTKHFLMLQFYQIS